MAEKQNTCETCFLFFVSLFEEKGVKTFHAFEKMKSMHFGLVLVMGPLGKQEEAVSSLSGAKNIRVLGGRQPRKKRIGGDPLLQIGPLSPSHSD